jgi:nucleoside-diphosphate-sugar epimerase
MSAHGRGGKAHGAVCVTGGLGFVGSRLCEALLEQGRSVRCVDSLVGRYAPGTGREAAARLAARGAEGRPCARGDGPGRARDRRS